MIEDNRHLKRVFIAHLCSLLTWSFGFSFRSLWVKVWAVFKTFWVPHISEFYL
ncbi:hypothetical protein I3760_13G096500 [Carya illinoinensis]|nr:hypothetical protein I3760_13G096500 [Carya illinoinensis]